MTLTTQFYTLLAMIGMGSYFGIALDTYNRFLNRGERNKWIVFLNDLLFWIVQTLSIFYVLFVVNHGELRIYLFLAIVCGFAFYQSLLKKSYLRLLEKLIQIVVKTWKFLVRAFFKLIINPINFIVMMLVSFVVFLGKTIFSLAKQIGKLLIWIIQILLAPCKWIFSLLWSFVPKSVIKTVEKFYMKIAGVFKKTKNTIRYFIKKFRKKQ